MAGKNEAKIKFTADTKEFTAQVTQANASLSALRAGLALNEAEFKNTGNASEYLQNKQKALNAMLDQSRSKITALQGKLDAAKSIYGENSVEAEQWQAKLSRAETEQEKLKTQLDETNTAITEQTKAEQKSLTPLEQLNNKMSDQRAELERLKAEYANVALSEGKDSQAAQELKSKIDALNKELDEEEKQLKDVTLATEEAGEATSSNSTKCTFFGNILANLASGVITQVTSKLKEAAAEVIKLGTDFTASLSNVQALSGATSAEMEKLEETAKALGRSTIFSATDVSDAFGYMALAGWDVQDMLSGIDGVLNLAASANMDLAKASDIVTDYLTAFGLSAQDSGKFVDQMAYAMANSNTDVEQLGEAYKNVAATAGSMGYSVSDTTAALMTMANAGVKGGEAGTGLNAIMTRLATNTKNCATELKKYGVEVYDEQGNMNSLSSILNGTAEVWNTLTDQQQANLAKTIAGQNHYSKLQTVMNGLSASAAESGQSFNDYTEALENCEGAAADMTETMQDNLAGDMKALGSAAQGLGLQLFDFFEGPLRGAAQGATTMLNAITDAITPQRTELETFIDEIEESNSRVQSVLANAESVMSGGTAAVGELEAYKNILLDLNSQTELDEYQQYQLKNAIDALGDSVPGLSSAFDETTGTLNLTNAELVEMFDNAQRLAMQQALIDAQAESYKALAEATLQKAKADSAVKAASDELTEANKKNSESASFLAGSYGDYYSEVMAADEALGDATKAQKEAEQAMADAQTQIDEENAAYADLREEYGLTSESLDELKDSEEAVADATEETAEAMDEAGEAATVMSEEEQEAAEKIQKAYEDLRDSVKDSMQKSVSFMDEFSGGAKITAEEMLENLQSQKEGLAQWSENMQRLAGEVGTGMTQEMYDALLEMGPQSANAVQTLVSTLENDRGQFEQIANTWAEALSYSDNGDVLASYSTAGKNAANALEGGLTSSAPAINSAVSNIAKTASKDADFSDLSKGSGNAIRQTETELKKGTVIAKTQMNQMKTTIQSSSGGMTGAMNSALGGVPGAAASKMSAALSNVRSYIGMMRSALSVSLRGPHVAVPHFSMSGAFNAQTGAVPHVGVSWWAKGGVFQRPTIIPTMYGYQGVGEAGKEAVLPIDTLKDYISEALVSGGAAPEVNVYMTVDGAESPEAWGNEFVRSVKQYMRTS